MSTYKIREVQDDGSIFEAPVSAEAPDVYRDREASQSVTSGFTHLPRWAIDGQTGAFLYGMAFVRGRGLNGCKLFSRESLHRLLRCGDLPTNPFPGVEV